ncbi:MAG: CaiB/BaiF CoA-transferase family protein [Gammaproteobacteria bacterium]|nr:CaiB/BaiF CoA-transferase family protein [Gammaproteobacteria bacterium]
MLNQLPLEGVLVVTLEQAVAAPVASCRLVDAGARVIKLERSTGDFARTYDTSANGQSAYFAWANRGKESLVVDIKNSEDVALIKRILSKADVYLQNLSVGAAARAGLGSHDLRSEFPHLITCDISGYGEKGDYAQMKAYDLLVQAESGLISISGGPGELGRVGVSIVDTATGISAALAINEALVRKCKTGLGTSVKLSLFDVMGEWMSVPLFHHEEKGKGPDRIGLAHPSITPYGGFATSDGHVILISVQNDREWEALATSVLKRPDLVEDPNFNDNAARMTRRSEVDGLVQDFFGRHTKAQMTAKLLEARLAFGSLNMMEEFVRHPLLRRWQVESETGSISVPAHPDANREWRQLSLPRIGEHSDAIRAEFAD